MRSRWVAEESCGQLHVSPRHSCGTVIGTGSRSPPQGQGTREQKRSPSGRVVVVAIGADWRFGAGSARPRGDGQESCATAAGWLGTCDRWVPREWARAPGGSPGCLTPSRSVVDRLRYHPDDAATLKRPVIIALLTVLPLGLMRKGPCEHCDAQPKAACHRVDAPSGGHTARRQGRSQEREPQGCPCGAHHLCAMWSSSGTAPSVVPPRGTESSSDEFTVLSAVANVPAIRPWDTPRPVGRASPPLLQRPLYLTTHSLLI